MSWTLLPENDERQRSRIQRLIILPIAGASVLLAMLAASTGYLSYPVMGGFLVLLALLVGGFYGLIRTGMNLRFVDPALTVAQLLAMGIAISVVVFAAAEARPAFIALYLMALLFGMLSLDLRRLLAVSAFYVVCYGVVVFLASRFQPETELRRELFRIVGVAVIFTGFSAIGAYVSRLRKDLEVVNARLLASLDQAQALARIDGLTGSYNRRHGLELLETECARAARGDALSVGLADLDHFKAINDSGGHAVGDAVLVRFAQIVQHNLRSTDFLVRYGGEEFLIVFSQTPIEGARLVAERLREATALVPIPAQPERRLSVSIGIAQHRPRESAEATVGRADAALYRAKHEGRDRVVSAEDVKLVTLPG